MASYLNEAIELFIDGTDVVCASHHWPTWGRDNVRDFMSRQRDMYAYIHDQTLRMMNTGYTGTEIAETFQVPPALEGTWSTRSYYGSVSHGVKATYQRYMGWFDGNPAHLWLHPPEDQGRRYIDVLGGIDKLLEAARRYAEDGDLRSAAELASHAVFGDPGNADAKETLAQVLTRLGHGSENATWRNFFLTGAHELRNGIPPTAIALASSLTPALTVTQLFDSIGIRVNGPKAWNEAFTIDWTFTDLGEKYRMTMSNGALIHYPDPQTESEIDLTLTLTKPQLFALLGGKGLDGVDHTGDAGVLARLMSVLEQPNEDFAIVAP